MHEEDKQERWRSVALALPSRETSHIYAVLRIDWPVAERVMVKLEALITTSTGGRPIGKSILRNIVNRAIKAYGRVLYGGKGGKTPDHVRIGVFMDCLLKETHDFIYTRQNIMHTSGESLGGTGRIDERELRSSLYELLVCDSLKQVLKEASFEEIILDGRTAVRN